MRARGNGLKQDSRAAAREARDLGWHNIEGGAVSQYLSGLKMVCTDTRRTECDPRIPGLVRTPHVHAPERVPLLR